MSNPTSIPRLVNNTSYANFTAGNLRYTSGTLEAFDGYGWHVVAASPHLHVPHDMIELMDMFSENKEAFREMVKHFSVIASAEKMKEEVPTVAECLKQLNRDMEELKTLIGLSK